MGKKSHSPPFEARSWKKITLHPSTPVSMRVGTPRASQEQATHRGEGQNGELEFGPTVILCSFQKKMSSSDQTNQHWRYSFFFSILFQLQLNPGLSSCLFSPFDILRNTESSWKSYSALLRRPSTELGEGHRKKSRRQNEIQVQRSATVASAKLRLKVFFKRHQCVLGVVNDVC